jgi:hypothetical protein
MRGPCLLYAAVLCLPIGCSYDYAQLQVKDASDVALVVEAHDKDNEVVPRGSQSRFDSPILYRTTDGDNVWASVDRGGLKLKKAPYRMRRVRDGEVLLSPEGRAALTQSVTVSKEFQTNAPSDLVRRSEAVPSGELRLDYPFQVETGFDPATGSVSSGEMHFSLRVPQENVAGLWQISRPNRGFGWVCFGVGLFLGGIGAGLTAAGEGGRGIPMLAIAGAPLFFGAYMVFDPETKTQLYPGSPPPAAQ